MNAAQLIKEISLDSWITADSHFAHRNIQGFCDRPDDHFALMRRLWKERVSPGELVLHLGDLVVYPKGEGWRYLKDLPGEKLLLKGNHDKEKDAFYEEWGFTVLKPPTITLQEITDHRERKHQNHCLYWHTPTGKRVLFSHYPDSVRLDWTINVHGHIHNDPRPYQNLPARDYRNVGVEVTGYGPVRLRDVLEGDTYAGRLGGAGQWRDISAAAEEQRRRRPVSYR